MSWLHWLFWVSLFIVFYAYVGYGILLLVFIAIRKIFAPKNTVEKQAYYPPVTLVIAAFNEEDFIREKIANTKELFYPQELLTVIFISDGSSDNTPGIIAEYPEFKLMHRPERKGKIAAIHRAMQEVQTEFVIFCDANTFLNKMAVAEIVKHYSDPKIGGVAGEKKVVDFEKTSNAGAGEGLYWKYESILKKLDSDFYTVVGAAGELFSVRTALYEKVGDNILLDDFIISLKICQKGYRVAYEPKAFAMEKPSVNIKEERKRKLRISAGAYQSIILLKQLLNIFKYPVLSFQYISHRVLRWTLCPLLLPLIFIVNAVLINDGIVFKALFILQSLFYFFAIAGWLLIHSGRKAGPFKFPYYFVFMNVSLYQGFFNFIKGKQSVLWDKAKRSV